MLQNLGGIIENFQFFPPFRGTKYQDEANNNCEAVIICARHVVKRPSKRSALVITNLSSRSIPSNISAINRLARFGRNWVYYDTFG